MKPLAKSLSDEQMKFWVANTSLTEEQIQQWYVEFQEHSKKNQKLDQENFIKFFEKLKHKSKSTKTSTEVFKILFKAFDSDNSGYVDFQEFLVAFNIIGDGEIEKRLEWMFKIYDVNNDGSIDRKEIETILRAILAYNKKNLVGDQTMETKLDELFSKLDLNENKKISREEFVETCSGNIFLRDTLCPNV